MSVDPKISLAIVQKEIEECQEYAVAYGWKFSSIDDARQSFTVEMKAIDEQIYLIEIKFDNYKELPLFIEFIDHKTGQKDVKTAYPRCNDSFFHPDKMCICNPCSRKAYAGYSGLHGDWQLIGWEKNQKVTTLISIKAILLAIYCRINNGEIYGGRMSA